MILRGALLGLLALRPRSGYELVQALRGPVAHVWTARHGQVYPAIATLAADGLIAPLAHGPRRRTTWTITHAGEAVLRSWLLEAPPSRESRNESLLRILFLGLVTEREASEYVERELEYHEHQLNAYRAVEATPVTGGSAETSWSRRVLEWGIAYEQAMIAWLRRVQGQGVGRPQTNTRQTKARRSRSLERDGDS